MIFNISYTSNLLSMSVAVKVSSTNVVINLALVTTESYNKLNNKWKTLPFTCRSIKHLPSSLARAL